ncbi:MAG: GNAT family N-acetyltransferase [Aureispira sp.]
MFSPKTSKQALSINSTTAVPLTNTTYHIKFSKSITELAESWDAAAPKDNLFLQYAYLNALEQFPPAEMSFKYAVVYKGQEAIAVLYQQIFHLNVEESLQQTKEEEAETNKQNCIIKAFSNAIKRWFLKRAEFNLLISGNLLLTGEYGSYFHPSIDEQERAVILRNSLEFIQHQLDKEGTKISVHLIKDYSVENCTTLKPQLQKHTYHPFLMQPSMSMDLRPHWATFEDYLGDMSSKYRVRAKRARKKGKAIVKKILSLEEIKANEERIYTLYKSIADNAGFNAFLLHPQYFTMLKEHLGDHYRLTAYYIEDELVAFYTAIFNGSEMDAHFLGVDASYNREHQVYLNILYDLVNLGIESKSERIDFARTALEIKSSVGAVSQDLLCFFKHRNTISSKFIQVVFDNLNPKEEWQPRQPFKVDKASVSS